MSNTTVKNLEALRAAMRKVNVDAVIIPGTDPHQSEYISDYWKFRDWITGFTGSNGTAVVALDGAWLWTDSRYFLQAEQQLADSGFELKKEGIPGEPTITEWLGDFLEPGSVVGIDGRLFSVMKVSELEEVCGNYGLRLATDFAPADSIWTDRPARPSDPAFVHAEEFAGESVDSKIERTLNLVHYADADATFIAALDDIAWLLNIRGNDVLHTPVVISYAYISDDERVLFIDDDKITPEVAAHLKASGIKVRDYDEVEKFLVRIKPNVTVLLDHNMVSDTLAMAMQCGKVYAKSPVASLKAVKNDVQIAGVRKAMERDGAALVRTFAWVEQEAPKGCITELDVAAKAIEERKKGENYYSESFGMIAGYKEHGAIVHYSATEESAATLHGEGLLLIDTGGQYLDGTTDITRTFSLGNPTADEKHDFTLVLKGHLALGRAKFPVGTRGAQLDVLARSFMWAEGKNYLHGTGHGVGHFLSVHEGPQSIRMNENPVALVPGMITSNEPGLYLAGRYGIRTENLVLTVADESSDEFGDWLKFENLTLFPYDTKLMDTTMLTAEEVAQINAYHREVRSRLAPYLSGEHLEWLESHTQEI